MRIIVEARDQVKALGSWLQGEQNIQAKKKQRKEGKTNPL